MKKEYLAPEFELFEFKIFDNLLEDGSYYSNSVRASGETPVPGYNEDVDVDFDFDF